MNLNDFQKAGEQREKVENHFSSDAHFMSDSMLRRAGQDRQGNGFVHQYPEERGFRQQGCRYTPGRRIRYDQGHKRELV